MAVENQNIVDIDGSTVGLPGYRLHTLEVLNWGTYNKPRIARCCLNGESSLLTGKNGSGKSTMVDALITLLIPYNRIAYNKAAGIEMSGRKAERSILTYFRGEYRNEKNEIDGTSKPVYLRGDHDYSVLLAYFYNATLQEGFTIAQVFWYKNEKIEKRFIFSDEALNIKDHFCDFGPEIAALLKRLRAHSNTAVYETFSEYAIRFRNALGLRSEKAMELFYQAVSIKTIGSLTTFMRQHMIESIDVGDDIEGLLRNYENLTRTHDVVLRAKRMQEVLAPLVADSDKYEQICRNLTDSTTILDALPAYFAQRKIGLLSIEIAELEKGKDVVVSRLNAIKDELAGLREREGDLKGEYAKNIGAQVNEIQQKIRVLEASKKQKKAEFDKYASIASQLGLAAPKDENGFVQNKRSAGELQKQNESHNALLTEERDKLTVSLHSMKEALRQVESEIRYCRESKSQIPEHYARQRNEILSQLGIPASEIPFAGELIRVKKDYGNWEAAIDTVLRGFATSMLVPEKHYKLFSEHVDRTNLKGKIVYYRVPAADETRGKVIHRENSIFHKIELKPDTPFYGWLDRQIAERYGYVCCNTIEDFRREPMALTQNGQIKAGRGRHEKDDRQRNQSTQSLVLGWGDAGSGRLQILAQSQKALDNDLEHVRGQIDTIGKNLSANQEKTVCIGKLQNYDEFSRLNWTADAKTIEELKGDVVRIEQSSDAATAASKTLEGIKSGIANLEEENDKYQKQLGSIENAIGEYRRQEQKHAQIAKTVDEKANLEEFAARQDWGNTVTLDTIDGIQSSATRKLRAQLGPKIKEQAAIRDQIIAKMKEFKDGFGEAASDLDARIEFAPDFKKVYNKLVDDDLPKYESKFKDLLNQGTINDIVIFKNRLENNADELKKRVREISSSLRAIEYNSGTYLELQFEPTQDVDVRAFKSMLNACLDQTEAKDVIYNEERFIKVKAILDKFMRGNTADANWTDKVTDVRNWFSFAAAEIYTADGSLKEYYADTGSKSGGQKERMAYSILSAALVFQYGLESEENRNKMFRLMMLDEAFSRGTDSAASYAMSLFTSLGFQVFVVTPEQKLHIIENFVKTIHYAYNNDEGNDSSVVQFSIEEHLKKRKAVKEEKREVMVSDI